MKHSVSFGIFAVIFALQPAAAEPPAPSPDGAWSFVTGKMGEGCTLRGAMTVTRKADKSLICNFEATWACEVRLTRAVVTQKTCTAKQTGSDITITSKVAKITKVDPPDLMDIMRANYAADHFNVKINARGDEMTGLFHSYGQARVIFRRKQDLIG